MDALDQAAMDDRMIELDGTPNKKKLGANAILGVSLATARAAARHAACRCSDIWAASNARLLPAPMMNIINGGAHADNAVDVQEFMVMPLGFDTFSDALRCGCEIFHHLKKVLHDKKLTTTVGDEGGFAPDLKSNAEALDLILEAIDKAGYKPGEQVVIALDVAATEFYDAEKKATRRRQADRLRPRMVEICWPVGSTSIPSARSKTAVAEDDWDGWKMLTERLATRSNSSATTCSSPTPSGCSAASTKGIANSILIKVNQIGTLTETIDAIELARPQRLHDHHQPPQRRDRRLDDRRPGRGPEHRPDQDRHRLADRPHGQVQPVAADRRDARRDGPVRRAVVQAEVAGGWPGTVVYTRLFNPLVTTAY